MKYTLLFGMFLTFNALFLVMTSFDANSAVEFKGEGLDQNRIVRVMINRQLREVKVILRRDNGQDGGELSAVFFTQDDFAEGLGLRSAIGQYLELTSIQTTPNINGRHTVLIYSTHAEGELPVPYPIWQWAFFPNHVARERTVSHRDNAPSVADEVVVDNNRDQSNRDNIQGAMTSKTWVSSTGIAR